MLSFLFGVLAACANATSSVLQRKANRDTDRDESLRPIRLVRAIVHEPVWFAGVLAVIVGFLLQAAALGHGQIALVQPLLALELPLTILLGSVFLRGRLKRLDWIAVIGMTAGLVVLLVSLHPGTGRPSKADGLTWGLGVAASLAVIGALVGYGWLREHGERAAALGAATGVAFGLTAALMSGMTAAFDHGIVGVLSAWQTWLMVLTGGLAMFLLQNALQAGRLIAAQPGITIADPIVAIGWGLTAFGERVHSGGWIAGEVIGALAMAGCAVLLSASRSSEDT